MQKSKSVLFLFTLGFFDFDAAFQKFIYYESVCKLQFILTIDNEKLNYFFICTFILQQDVMSDTPNTNLVPAKHICEIVNKNTN